MIRDFLKVSEFSDNEVQACIDNAIALKADQKAGKSTPILQGKTLVMIFEKPSTRTRLSFEIGMFQLGGLAIDLKASDIQMGTRETIPDVSRVISRYADMVMIRSNRHEDVEAFADQSSIPVINGLSDTDHPCQAIADLMTVQEKKGPLKGLKMTYVGDGNNVCHSLIEACNATGVIITVACPEGYEPTMEGGDYAVVHNPKDAITGADVVYTDVWTSMGQEEETQKRLRDFSGYEINSDLMKLAKSDAIFMHCLPAHRGEEVSHDVVESDQSVVFDQAENRLHAQKAIMVAIGGSHV
ncbi:ornithine carbamoyltransferase [bacterium]|jgi:ornithine carbamoyltransferase|nr:ornithine carbamoyltransferase [bacterium]